MFLFDLHKGFCSAHSAVVKAAENVTALWWPNNRLLTPSSSGWKISSSLFDSQPKTWMSEMGPSDTQTNDHHAQWKNWHMSDRVQENGQHGWVNACLLLIWLWWNWCCPPHASILLKTHFHTFPHEWVLLGSLSYYSLYSWRRTNTEGTLLWWNVISRDTLGVSTNPVCSIL